MLIIEVSDDSDARDVVEALQRVLPFAFELLDEAPAGTWTVAIMLAGPDEISQLHSQFFGDPSDTDVMSFPSGDLHADSSGHLGDIAISTTMAASQASDHGQTFEREIVFLALHGLLHLLGHDDRTTRQRQDMMSLQSRLLDAYDAAYGGCT